MYDLWDFPVGNVVSRNRWKYVENPSFFGWIWTSPFQTWGSTAQPNLFRHLAPWAHVALNGLCQGCKKCTATDICPKFKKSKCCCEGATFVCHFWPRFWTLKRQLFLFFASSIYFIDHRLCRCYGRREVIFQRLRSSSRRVSLRGMMCVVTWGDWFIDIYCLRVLTLDNK